MSQTTRVFAPRRRRRQRWLVVAAILIGALAVPGWSLGRTLAANTTDPLGARVVEWARDHQLGGIVNAIERYWYSHHQPPKGGSPKGGIPRAPALADTRASKTRRVRTASRKPDVWAPPNIRPLVAHPLPGEGKWQPSGRRVHGRPALWLAYLRPDAVHTSLVAGVAYLDMRRVTATLHAGTEVPGGGPWQHGSQIAT